MGGGAIESWGIGGSYMFRVIYYTNCYISE